MGVRTISTGQYRFWAILFWRLKKNRRFKMWSPRACYNANAAVSFSFFPFFFLYCSVCGFGRRSGFIFKLTKDVLDFRNWFSWQLSVVTFQHPISRAFAHNNPSNFPLADCLVHIHQEATWSIAWGAGFTYGWTWFNSCSEHWLNGILVD